MNLSITGKKYSVVPNDKKINSISVKPKLNNPSQISSKIQQKPLNVIKKNQTKTKVESKKQNKKLQKESLSLMNSTKKEEKKNQLILSEPPKLQQKIQHSQAVQAGLLIQPLITQTVVRYNHYKDSFPVQNSILSFSVIEQKYGFNLVFKGNYLPVLKLYRQSDQIEPLTQGESALQYSWKVQQGKQYQVYIQEDQEEQSKYQKKTYKAPETLKRCSCKKNVRVDMLTAEMKKLQIEELGSQKHKQLLQQRDLQQILFS